MRKNGLYLIVTLIFASCSGGTRNVGDSAQGTVAKDKLAEETSSGESAEEAPAEVNAFLHFALEMEMQNTTLPKTRVDIVETNETGANVRHDVGVFDGICTDLSSSVRETDPQVFLAFRCEPVEKQRGVLVHVLHRQSRLVLLRAWLGTTKPNFDDFDQIGELPPHATGISVRTDYDSQSPSN